MATDIEQISLEKKEKKEEKKEEKENTLEKVIALTSEIVKKHGSITSKNILPITHSVMELIETMKEIKEMKGAQKKELCMDCLHWLVDHSSDLSEEDKQTLHTLVDNVAPSAIDLLVAVSKGMTDLVVNKLEKCDCPCF